MRNVLNKLGYCADLYSSKARSYVLSVHSETESVKMEREETNNSLLDHQAGLLIMQLFGKLKSSTGPVEWYQLNDK
jgi:hypothetical protein